RRRISRGDRTPVVTRASDRVVEHRARGTGSMNGTHTAWRTLIVDDEPLAREGIRARLAALGGFDVVDECGSGRAAIAAIRSQRPDVVFLDVQMPVVD